MRETTIIITGPRPHPDFGGHEPETAFAEVEVVGIDIPMSDVFILCLKFALAAVILAIPMMIVFVVLWSLVGITILSFLTAL